MAFVLDLPETSFPFQLSLVILFLRFDDINVQLVVLLAESFVFLLQGNKLARINRISLQLANLVSFPVGKSEGRFSPFGSLLWF